MSGVLMLLAGSGGVRPFDVVHTAQTAASGTVWTIAGANLGVADANRRVVVSLAAVVTGAGFTISSLTINGVAATVHEILVSNLRVTLVASAIVPTGATGDIVITGSIAFGNFAVACVYRAINYGVGSSSSGTSGTDTVSTTHNTGGGGETVWASTVFFGSIGTRTASGNFTTADYIVGNGSATQYGSWSRAPTSGASETNTLTWTATGTLSQSTVNFT